MESYKTKKPLTSKGLQSGTSSNLLTMLKPAVLLGFKTFIIFLGAQWEHNPYTVPPLKDTIFILY